MFLREYIFGSTRMRRGSYGRAKLASLSLAVLSSASTVPSSSRFSSVSDAAIVVSGGQELIRTLS